MVVTEWHTQYVTQALITVLQLNINNSASIERNTDTFASNYAAYFRHLPTLQLEMGHRDLSLLQSRYLNPRHTPPREARRFWEMAHAALTERHRGSQG